jgi:preprotein translocase subunit SecD
MLKSKHFFILCFFAISLLFLSISCQKAEEPQPEQWIQFDVKINTDSLDLAKIEDQNVLDQWIEQSIEILGNRLSFIHQMTNFTRDEIYRDRFIIKIPNYIDVTGKELAKILIVGKGLIDWKLVLDGPFTSKQALLSVYNGNIPDNSEIVRGQGYFLVSRDVVIANEDIKEVKVIRDSSGNSAIAFKFNENGARKMLDFTSENIGKQLAVVYDGVCIFVSRIEERMSKESILHGEFNDNEARVFSIILSGRTLPSSIQILDEKIVAGSPK